MNPETRSVIYLHSGKMYEAQGYNTDEATNQALDIMEDYESLELSLTQTKYTVETEPVSEDSDLDPLIALLTSGEDPTVSQCQAIESAIDVSDMLDSGGPCWVGYNPNISRKQPYNPSEEVSPSKKVKSVAQLDACGTLGEGTANKEQQHADISSKQGGQKRFADVSVMELNNIKKPFIPENTRRKNKWAYNIFTTWRKEFWENGEIKGGEKGTVYDLLSKSELDIHSFSDEDLNSILSIFVASLRKADGSLYKGESVLGIICGIQRHLATEGHPVDFFADSTFKDLKTTLDRTMQSMCEKGVSLQRKKAEVISTDKEEILWAKGILGTATPRALVDTVFWKNGINFGLRGGMEHRKLSRKNFDIRKDSDGFEFLEYTETVSKTYRGGLKHRNIDPHSARAYANAKNPDRCPVRIFKLYIAKLHPKSSPDSFYFRPLEKPKEDIWFCLNIIGHNKLEGTVKRLMSEANMEGYFTNHSLRATTATRLFQLDVPEQLIREQTGHRSEAVESYKRTSDCQKRRISELLRDSAASTSKTPPGAKEKKMESNLGLDRADTGSSTVVSNCGSVIINQYYI